MGTLLRWLVLLPVFLLVVAFAIANRGAVLVSFDPFDAETPAVGIEMPLFLVVLLSVFAGLLIGGIADWVAQGRHRRRARKEHRQVRKLEREVERHRAEEARQKAEGSAATPETRSLPAR